MCNSCGGGLIPPTRSYIAGSQNEKNYKNVTLELKIQHLQVLFQITFWYLYYINAVLNCLKRKNYKASGTTVLRDTRLMQLFEKERRGDNNCSVYTCMCACALCVIEQLAR